MSRPPAYDETREAVRSALCIVACAPIFAFAVILADVLR